jgi:hypothetical protein
MCASPDAGELAGRIADGILAAAFTRHGVTVRTCDAAAIAVLASGAFAGGPEDLKPLARTGTGD